MPGCRPEGAGQKCGGVQVTCWLFPGEVALTHVAGIWNGAAARHWKSAPAAAEEGVLRPGEEFWARHQQNCLHRGNKCWEHRKLGVRDETSLLGDIH